MKAWRIAWVAAAISATGSPAEAQPWRRAQAGQESLLQRVDDRVKSSESTRVPCELLRAGKPLVLLALGQSNAANFGTARGHAGPGAAVNVVTEHGCHRTSDPLPGAAGRGGSVWSRLPAALAAAGIDRPVVFGLMAVDASSIREWTDPTSPLPALLDKLSRTLGAAGLRPVLVLWQQGEADARTGTTPSDYARGLQDLASRLHDAGVDAPILLARSTVCRSAPAAAVRSAVQGLVSVDPRFSNGPDIDRELGPDTRSDGCHFNGAGLDAAAALWARAVAGRLR